MRVAWLLRVVAGVRVVWCVVGRGPVDGSQRIAPVGDGDFYNIADVHPGTLPAQMRKILVS